ncbi:MAG: hypothetical protein FH749_12675 [Firmicutes bacterium]|nr:hypothetical protein [Bacillota bacterium]
MMTLLLRLVIIVMGTSLYSYFYPTYKASLLSLLMMLITLFFTALLVELTPFNRPISLKKGGVILPVVILGILLISAWIGYTYGDWIHSQQWIYNIWARIFYTPALPIVSTFMGILLAKALKAES